MIETKGHFIVQTMFGTESRQPLVRISYGEEGQEREIAAIPSEEATRLAMNLLKAAQASLTDAFLVSFLEQRVGAEREHVMGIMAEFRDWRMGRAMSR